jgi:hypothetical protein
MPTVHRIGKVKIQLYPREHGPPHFHAWLAGREVLIEIETLEILVGSLPGPELRQVLAWAEDNRTMLRKAWNDLQQGRVP